MKGNPPPKHVLRPRGVRLEQFALRGMLTTVALGYLFPRLRLVEDELPDNAPPTDADAEEDIEETAPAAASS